MIDPDNFEEGDTPDITAAKRLVLTLDILEKYSPILQEISERPYDDPTRMPEYDETLKKMKEEMDKRFAEATKKPIIKPWYVKDGHPIKGGRVLSPQHYVVNFATTECLGTCQHCGKKFFKSKYRRKYCSNDCEEQAKRKRYIEKRREKRRKSSRS